MRKMNKKGFTIVELVIVIAVIAILAAVLIPTYSSLVKKANESADIQAVRQMNTILATYTDGSVTDVTTAVKALDKEDIDLENYKPMQKDHYFYFYMDGNTPKIVYMDEKDNVVFPKDAKTENVQLMSLSGDVPVDKTWKNKESTTGGVVSVEIANGGQFADFLNNIDSYMVDTTISEIKITLTGNVDMHGSTASFGEVKKTITLDGKGYTISGIRADKNSVDSTWENKEKDKGFALFNYVAKNVSVTIKDIGIKDCVVENTEGKAFGQSGILFGQMLGTATIENVLIENCKVVGGDKAGAVIGCVEGGGKASLTDVTVKNTIVSAVGWTAKAVGCVKDNGSSITIDNSSNFDGVTVSWNEAQYQEIWVKGDTNNLTGKDVVATDFKMYFENDSNTYVPYNKDENGAVKMEGVCTNDLYWTNSWKDATLNNTAVKVPNSSSALSYTENKG